jgi:hypothetical protein
LFIFKNQQNHKLEYKITFKSHPHCMWEFINELHLPEVVPISRYDASTSVSPTDASHSHCRYSASLGPPLTKTQWKSVIIEDIGSHVCMFFELFTCTSFNHGTRSQGPSWSQTSYLIGLRFALVTRRYSLRPIILDTFYWNKNIKKFERNLQKCPTRTSSRFESTFQWAILHPKWSCQ